jgi:hypothetical protein
VDRSDRQLWHHHQPPLQPPPAVAAQQLPHHPHQLWPRAGPAALPRVSDRHCVQPTDVPAGHRSYYDERRRCQQRLLMAVTQQLGAAGMMVLLTVD